MKRNKCFLLREIGQVPYLLPFGQAIADQQRGCRINETGAYLWRLLERDTTPEELLEALAAHYDASREDLPGLKKDLEEFLSTLRYFGILVEDGPASVDAPFVRYLRAGGLNLKFVGMPVTLPEQFDGFGCGEPSHVHQAICIHPRRPRRHWRP